MISTQKCARSTEHEKFITKDALLEIGSEELPASFIPLGMQQLKVFADESLKASGLPYASLTTFGTPRRLAIVISDLADRTEDQKKVITGPPASIARDEQGQWTAAALGFARKQGMKPSDLTMEGDRLSATLHIKGVATRKLLADLFPQWISKLEFPKSMIWEAGHFRYPRPIRWITAVYGQDLVSFCVAGVRSTRWTLGLGPYAPKKIPIASAAKYLLLLKNQCVLVDPEARREAIRRLTDQAVKRVHGKAHLPGALLEEVAHLVEYPVAILGNFDAAYLDLPKEVLITCLEHHQKFFPVEGPGDKLLPHFVGIRNGMSIHQEIVREGYERVLAARLADARFFWSQDRRSTLAAKVDALHGVVFQEKLGTLFEKKERVKSLLRKMADGIPGSSWGGETERAAELAKADLVTKMVREFPELQGVMARLYAQEDGETPLITESLEQHYWPLTLSSPLPESPVASAVAVADKLDTLAGDFAVGLIPSGSADPYGLRRAAVGILRILESQKWPLRLEDLVSQAVDLQPENVRAAAADAPAKLLQFLQQRFAAVLEERGFKFDEIDAVLAAGLGIVHETLARLQALHELRTQPGFEPLSVAFKRGMNIVKQAAKTAGGGDSGNAHVQTDLLREPCEQTLYQAIESAGGQITQHLGARAYRQALESMIPLREPLDGFFTGVMVMDEDPALRANRLALMRRLVGLFSQIADFSKLQNA